MLDSIKNAVYNICVPNIKGVPTTKRLKELRTGCGFSQDGMAKHLGVSLSFYEKVERGDMKPSRNFMLKVKARFPHVSMDSIFFDQDSTDNAV